MKHLAFLYYTLSYSIGLPSLAIAIMSYVKTDQKVIKYYIPYLFSITFQLIFATVLQYQNANLPVPNTYPNVEAKYLYFLAESSIIFTMPLFYHKLTHFAYAKRLNIIFGSLFTVSIAIIISPFFVRYVPEHLHLSALPGLFVYRVIFYLSVTYSLFLIIIKFHRLTDKLLKIFAVISILFIVVTLLEILHCELFPILNHSALPFPLSPLGYFIINLIFTVFVLRQFFAAPEPVKMQQSNSLSYSGLLIRYNITDREKEIIGMLAAGCRNKDIAQKLFISESTVRTHIKNIYKKMNIRNRVQLVNFLRDDASF